MLDVGPDFVPILDAIADNLTHVTTVLVIGGHERFSDDEEWINSFDPIDPGTESALDDVAFFSLLPMAKELWELTPDSVNLVAMPLFHIAGGGWAVAGMYAGCTSIIFRDLDPVALVATIAEHRITHVLLVPVALQFVPMVPGVEDADYSSLRVTVCGASPISDRRPPLVTVDQHVAPVQVSATNDWPAV